MMGDFNALPDSPEVHAMIGATPTPAKGQARYRHGFTDAWAEANGADGAGSRIDYVFVANAIAGRIRAARVDTVAAGSGHQPPPEPACVRLKGRGGVGNPVYRLGQLANPIPIQNSMEWN